MIRARLGALVLPLVLPFAPLATSLAQTGEPDAGRAAIVVQADDATLEELLAVRGFRGFAAYGGGGLLVRGPVSVRDAVGSLLRAGPGARPDAIPGDLSIDTPSSLEGRDGHGSVRRIEEVATGLHERLLASRASEVVVIVAVNSPPSASEDAGDEVGAIVFARGRPTDIADAMERGDAAPGSLTSDSTRRDGVVATVDIAATIVGFLGTDRPGDELGGASIQAIAGPPPFELHARYLEQRRLTVPIGTAAALWIAVAGLVASALLALGRRAPERARRIAGWASLATAALGTALLAVGHLPELTYANVLPFVLLVSVFGTLAFAPLERQDLTLVPAAIAVAVLGYFAVEAALGWTGMLTPLLGGSQLDGGRFYGLPNVAIGLLIGASLWVAQRLSVAGGAALLGGVALFAGLPYLGSNLGGAVSLFATLGLWVAVRERRRLGPWRGLAVVVGATVLGTLLILLAHALAPIETHVTAFERSASGAGDVLGKFVDRLRVGSDLIGRNPAALVPVIGIPATLLVALRPPGAIRATFERWPAWRDAIVVTLLGGAVAYVANDSGPAAVGLAFGLALGGMVGVSLLAGPGKMGADG